MVRALLLMPMLAGCKLIAGIDETTVIPDAAPPDVSIDVAPDARVELPIDVGTGEDGPLIVSNTSYTDENRTRITSSVGAGSTRIEVGEVAGFGPDDEVLIIQMSGPDAGYYETHRIATIGADHFILHTALAGNFDAQTHRAQIIRVFQWSTVDVPANATLTAHAWDAASGTGGVVFFRASGAVSIAGTISVDALGWRGGLAGTVAPLGGGGGDGGGGGNHINCPTLCNSFAMAGGGGAGKVVGMGAAGAGSGTVNQMCRGGAGGVGGIAGMPGDAALSGERGDGDGGGIGEGDGGKQLAIDHARPMFGGGGSAGSSGAGGIGGGGGGGGGGPVTASTISGGPGGAGESGGAGGLGGGGGIGGGIVVVNAASFELAGTIRASGAAGTEGSSGAIGGAGGIGGYGTTWWEQQNCAGSKIYGGRGGGGVGAGGGNGGGGGGGGAGGTVVVNARAMTVSGGMIITLGGEGRAEGGGGMGGEGGGGHASGATGPVGQPGVAGRPGDPGRSYIRHANSCEGCAGVGDPATTVIVAGS